MNRLTVIALADEAKNYPASFRFFPFDDYNPASRQRKRRWLGDPSPGMKRVHDCVMRFIRRNRWVKSPAARCITGALNGCSIVTDVLRHRYANHIIALDIKDAYPSVDLDRMTDALLSIAYDPADRDQIKAILKEYFFLPKGGLVTGASASPDLFNLYCHVHLDWLILDLCERLKARSGIELVYTRYLDDLKVSSTVPLSRRVRAWVLKEIQRLVGEAGLRVHARKTQVINLARARTTAVNGIGLEHGGRIYMPRHQLQKSRDELKQPTASLKDKATIRRRVQGRVSLMISQLDKAGQKPNGTERALLKAFR